MRDRESGPQPGRARDVSEKDRVMILAGDIGGTNSRLANFEVVQGRVHPIVEETFPSRGSASLDDIECRQIVDWREEAREVVEHLHVERTSGCVAMPVVSRHRNRSYADVEDRA